MYCVYSKIIFCYLDCWGAGWRSPVSSSCENSGQEARVEGQQFSGSICFKNTINCSHCLICMFFIKPIFLKAVTFELVYRWHLLNLVYRFFKTKVNGFCQHTFYACTIRLFLICIRSRRFLWSQPVVLFSR